MIASMKASLLLKLANMTSSKRKGKQRAIANGHPRIPPTANKTIPWVVFRPPFQFMNEAMPAIVVYIAKLDGRKDADAWNMPGLKTIAIKKNMATRGFKVPLMTRNIHVWQRAHVKARAYRIK